MAGRQRQRHVELTAKDFKTDQEVRWCPGCGDYAILAAMQGFMPELGIERERLVFVSGIGCAARFPYYMQTYGMHSIHGRAPAIATGLADVPARPVRLGRDRRRRRALDRRQPPDPRAAPQRQREDPALQQPDLRADEGPVLADVRAGQGDEVDADGLARPPVQPDVARDRRGGDLRRALDRHRPQAPDRGAAPGGRPQGHGLRRDLPELQHLQRRRVRRGQGAPGEPDPARARPADPLRRGRRARRPSSGPTARASSSTSPTSGRTRCSSTTSTTRRRASRSRSRGSRTRPTGPTPFGVFRDVERPVYDELMAEQIAAATEKRGAGDLARAPPRRRHLDDRLGQVRPKGQTSV